MSVTTLAEDSFFLGQSFSIFEPNDIGFRRGMNDANDFSFVVLAGVNERLLLLDGWRIWKFCIKLLDFNLLAYLTFGLSEIKLTVACKLPVLFYLV